MLPIIHYLSDFRFREMTVSVCNRCQAGLLLENAVEISLVPETNGSRDLRDREVRAGQYRAGVFDPDPRAQRGKSGVKCFPDDLGQP